MSSIPAKSKLDEYAKLGLVHARRHPELPLTIYVYSEFTAFDRLWNSVTKACRGLVVDDNGRCVVRCLPKFFNEDEPHAICEIDPISKPIFFDKLDGSLIQVVNDPEYGLIVTSKGSFGSDQVQWAKQIMAAEGYTKEDFEKDKTYVFELIHPENRIVLDYGSEKALYLLAVIDTEGGQEYDINRSRFIKFTKVKVVTDFNQHMSQLVEGVVAKVGDHRYKVKTGEYVRLHRIVTEFTPKRVWEALRDGDSLEFKNMPEEFSEWLQNTIDGLKADFNAIIKEINREYNLAEGLTNKELGLSRDFKHKGSIFMLRNNKSVDQAVWKMVKPKKEEIASE